jgi:hypothetical protein
LKIEVKQSPANAWNKFDLIVTQLTGKVGKVGWIDNSRYPDENGKQGPLVAYVATIQEFGYPAGNIPPRPTIRPAIATQQDKWRKIALKYSKLAIEGKGSVADIFEAVGAVAEGDIAKNIKLLTQPPLSPRTIAARLNRKTDKKTIGSLDKPLIDTGLMLATLTHTVEDE